METITAMVPANLRALIELQLAHLSSEDQTLLEAASVAGVEFSAAAVAAALERAEEVVEARCTALAQQGQFLQARGRCGMARRHGDSLLWLSPCLVSGRLISAGPGRSSDPVACPYWDPVGHGFGEGAGEMAAALAMHFVRGRLLPQAVPVFTAGRTAGRPARRASGGRGLL